MGDLPYTKKRTSPEREEAIREAVRSVTAMPSDAAQSAIARPSDAPGLLNLFSYPEVYDWIYTLPRPLTLETTESFIRAQMEAHSRGEGLLSLNFDEAGIVSGYSEVIVWPQWAAGEVGGAIRPDLQNRGQGARGMARTFTWMFETFDLDIICNTTATDNVRMQAIFRKTGFDYKGDTESRRPDGSIRQSQIWEITRDAWFARQGDGQAGVSTR